MTRAAATVLLELVLAWPTAASADEGQDPHPDDVLEPEQVVTGVERPARESSDAARDTANVALFVPRNVVDYFFRGTEAAALYVADEQLVPRYRELLGTPPGADFFVYPTLFAETGAPFSVGLRMIVDTPNIAAAQRIGFGGVQDLVSESRVVFKGIEAYIPYALAFEFYFEDESQNEYLGLGITPEADPRNQFQPGNDNRVGLYFERRTHYLASIGLRLGPEFEFLLSASLARRQVEDSPDSGGNGLGRTFVAGSVPGLSDDTWMFYAENAARIDTREARGGHRTPGALVEAYWGGARSAEGAEVVFMRAGLRAGGFIPIYRRTNLLSPVVRIDRLVPLGSTGIPFNELPRQPEFRGFDNRRDNMSIVGSLDYSWELTSFMGMRVFGDVATVAPSLAEFTYDQQIKNLRYAGGLGVDFFTRSAELARIEVAGSPEGARLLLSIGSPGRFGDRQHRQ